MNTINDINRLLKKGKFAPGMEINELFGLPIRKYAENTSSERNPIPLNSEIKAYLDRNGYKLLNFLGASNNVSYRAISEKYGEVALVATNLGIREKFRNEDIYRSLVGVDTGVTANLYAYDQVGNNEIWIEEKAICTIEDYAKSITNLDSMTKINFLRGIYDLTIDLDAVLVDQFNLTHADPNIGNLGIFLYQNQLKIKYIDLESLQVSDGIGHVFNSFDMIQLLELLFPQD